MKVGPSIGVVNCFSCQWGRNNQIIHSSPIILVIVTVNSKSFFEIQILSPGPAPWPCIIRIASTTASQYWRDSKYGGSGVCGVWYAFVLKTQYKYVKIICIFYLLLRHFQSCWYFFTYAFLRNKFNEKWICDIRHFCSVQHHLLGLFCLARGWLETPHRSLTTHSLLILLNIFFAQFFSHVIKRLI